MINHKPRISVIMPVYNAEKYLENSVTSVINQTFQDFELLLIDDGSTDRSGEICDVLASNDKRIKVVHKKNGGICDARNKGLDLAQGEYIAFIDNDDEYAQDLLKDNYELANKYSADIVKFGVMREEINNNGDIINETKLTINKEIVIDSEKYPDVYMDCAEKFINLYIWNGIYKRNLIESVKLRFNVLHKFGYEDVEFNMDLAKYFRKLVINPNIYYYYIQRINYSTSFKFDLSKLNSIIYMEEKEKLLLQSWRLDERRVQDRLLSYYIVYLNSICSRDSKLSLKEQIDLMKKYKECVNIIPFYDWKQLKVQFSVSLFNHNHLILLILIKKIWNKIKKSK